MKIFIQRLLGFLIIPIITVVPILFIFTIYIDIKSAHYHIDSNVSSIYIGDSHIRVAINDSIIPESINLATNSESFYYSYYKLKILLENNPSIKTVYLGLSYHSLSNQYDRFVSGDYSSATAPRYFYVLPLKEKTRIINWNKSNMVSFVKSTIKQGIVIALLSDNYPFLGGFSNQFIHSKAVNSSMDKRLHFQFYNNKKLRPFSKFNIYYLNEIVNLCKSRGVHLITLNTPLHNYYYKKIPLEYRDKLDYVISAYQLQNIDLSKMELSDECYIPDGDHVSYFGAKAISVALRDTLSSIVF